MSPDEATLRQLVTDYYTGLANLDTDRIVSTLCPDDAQGYRDSAYTDEDWGPPDEPVQVSVEIVDVRIDEPYAVIRHTPSMSGTEGLLYAQRFDGQWLLCDDAEYAIQAADMRPPAGPAH